MGTLATIIIRARIKDRDVDKNLYTDTELVHLVNGVLHEVYDALKGVESNLVYAEDTQATEADVMEYTPSFNFEGIMPEGVWRDGGQWYMTQGSEADKVKYDYANQTGPPRVFYLTEDGKIGFLPVPDDAYTVHFQFWQPLTELDVDDYDDDDLPWFGLWDQFVEERLVSEMLAIQERDTSWRAAILNGSYVRCMGKTFQRGCRPRKFVSDFFSVDGI